MQQMAKLTLYATNGKTYTICNKWQNLHYMQQMAKLTLYATNGKTYTICNNWQ